MSMTDKPSDVLRVAGECGFCEFVLSNEIESLERFAAAMYAAGADGAIPAGYVLVPVEPTPEMEEAGCDVDCPQDGAPTPYSVYKAMIAALPITTNTEGEQG